MILRSVVCTLTGLQEGRRDRSDADNRLAGFGFFLRKAAFGDQRVGHRQSNKGCAPLVSGLWKDAGVGQRGRQVRKFVRKTCRTQSEDNQGPIL